MADFVQFTEGSNWLAQHGWPSPVWFLLSSAPVGVLTPSNTLAGGVSEITGTNYSRISQLCPTPVGGVLVFSTMIWQTGSAVDWPADVYSIIAATTNNNTGVAICAWNLQVGGGARDLSAINTTEEVTPTYVT